MKLGHTPYWRELPAIHDGHMAEFEALAAEIEDGVVEFVSDGHGTVTVEGWVASFDGHVRALDIATHAPGVRSVDDRLEILLARA